MAVSTTPGNERELRISLLRRGSRQRRTGGQIPLPWRGGRRRRTGWLMRNTKRLHFERSPQPPRPSGTPPREGNYSALRVHLRRRGISISPLPLAGEGPGERVFKIPLQRRENNSPPLEGWTPKADGMVVSFSSRGEFIVRLPWPEIRRQRKLPPGGRENVGARVLPPPPAQSAA
jgi:hypothetical protein